MPKKFFACGAFLGVPASKHSPYISLLWLPLPAKIPVGAHMGAGKNQFNGYKLSQFENDGHLPSFYADLLVVQ